MYRIFDCFGHPGSVFRALLIWFLIRTFAIIISDFYIPKFLEIKKLQPPPSKEKEIEISQPPPSKEREIEIFQSLSSKEQKIEIFQPPPPKEKKKYFSAAAAEESIASYL